MEICTFPSILEKSMSAIILEIVPKKLDLILVQKNIVFQYANYVDEQVMVIADPEQIRRVVNNIISNSCKYFDKSQCFINMRIKDVGDFIQVEIEDNGKGIATKDIPYII